MKTCATCRDTKPLTAFHRQKSSTDGRRSSCMTCRNAKRRASALAPGQKTCPKCHETLSTVCFYLRRGGIPRAWCISCERAYKRTSQGPTLQEAATARLAVGEKQCTQCDEPKPLAQFYAKKGSLDGRESACKACRNTRRQAQHVAPDPEDVERAARWQRKKAARQVLLAAAHEMS